MKTNPALPSPLTLRALSFITFLALTSGAHAADRYWDGTSNSAWGTNGNWSSDPNADGSVSFATINDDVFFNISTLATFNAVYLNAGRSANSLTILSTATTGTTIRSRTGDSNNLTLTLGGGGISVESGAGLFIFQDGAGLNADGSSGLTGNTGEVTVDLSADQNWEINNSAGMISYSKVSGSGNLTKTGTGTLTLANSNNSYTGKTIINKGTISISNSGALGTVPGSVVADQITLNGGTLAAVGGNVDINYFAGGAAALNNGITLGASGGTFAPAAGDRFLIDSAITGSGDLTVDGPGQMFLRSGDNDYTGNTFVRQGELKVGTYSGAIAGTDDRLPTGTVLTLGGGTNSGSFEMNAQSQELAGLTTDGTGTANKVSNSSGGAAKVLTINNDSDYTFSGTIESNLSLVKKNTGVFTLTGINTYAGGTTVEGGVLEINADAALGATPGSFEADNITLSNGGALKMSAGAGVTLGMNRGITLDSGGVLNNAADQHTINGAITGSGGLTFTGDNGGTDSVTLNSGASDYTGSTTIDNTAVTTGVANALSASSALYIGGAGGGTSAVDINGLDQEIGGLAFVSGSHTREVRNNGASAATLTLNVATGESYQWNANFNGTNAINIVKTGDGTQIFGRSGGYSTALGDITVNGGELIWDNNDASTQTGTVTVNSGGTLSGSGILGGAVTVSGTLNPGNSPGTMSFTEDLTLTGTAITNLEFTGTGLAGEFDVLLGDTGNTLTAGGTLNLVVDGYTAVLNDTFLVFEDWASFAGSFSSITGTDLGGGLSFDTSNLLTDGTLTVVPEPSTYALLAGMLAFFTIALRRRVK